MNDKFTECKASVYNAGIETFTLRKWYPIALSQQGCGIHIYPLSQGTHR